MPNAILNYSYDVPVPSAIALVVGNSLRVKLEKIDKRHTLVAVSDVPNLLAVTGTTHNTRADTWAFVIKAQRDGIAKLAIQVQQGQGAPALTISPPLVTVNIRKALELPPASSEEGLLVRLLLAEAPAPQNWRDNGVKNLEDAKEGMRLMRRVIVNRLASGNTKEFGAAAATTLADIVRASDGGRVQFKGFNTYPTIAGDQQKQISDVLAVANDATKVRWSSDYLAFYEAALEVASESLPPDPSPTGLFGWRTSGSGAPSNEFTAFKTSGGNTFFMHSRYRAR